MRLTIFKENYWPSNDNLYKETKQTPWAVKITKRRLTFFGHVCHLPETTPVKITLREALRPSKKTRGRPKYNISRSEKDTIKGETLSNIR